MVALSSRRSQLGIPAAQHAPRIFRGDVGSTLLGYTFAALPVLAFLQMGDARLFLVGILCVAPFVLNPSG